MKEKIKNPTLLDACKEARSCLRDLSKITIHEDDSDVAETLITLDLAIAEYERCKDGWIAHAVELEKEAANVKAEHDDVLALLRETQRELAKLRAERS